MIGASLNYPKNQDDARLPEEPVERNERKSDAPYWTESSTDGGSRARRRAPIPTAWRRPGCVRVGERREEFGAFLGGLRGARCGVRGRGGEDVREVRCVYAREAGRAVGGEGGADGLGCFWVVRPSGGLIFVFFQLLFLFSF